VEEKGRWLLEGFQESVAMMAFEITHGHQRAGQAFANASAE
jgi:hypothetical protein